MGVGVLGSNLELLSNHCLDVIVGFVVNTRSGFVQDEHSGPIFILGGRGTCVVSTSVSSEAGKRDVEVHKHTNIHK